MESGPEKVFQVGHSGLGSGVEDGVAAPDIRPDGMGFADAVAHGDAVSVAGSASVS